MSLSSDGTGLRGIFPEEGGPTILSKLRPLFVAALVLTGQLALPDRSMAIVGGADAGRLGETGAGRIWFVAASGSAGSGGSCGSPDFVAGGPVSASEAISLAISLANSGDTLHLCSGTFDVTTFIEVPARVTDLTIDGDASTFTALDGGGISQLLIVAGPGTLRLRHLELRAGMSRGDGGAVHAEWRSIVVEDARLTANEATSGMGGAITGASLEVTGSLFSDNTAGIAGGAIRASGHVSAVHSVFERNGALDLMGRSAGGGIDSGGSVTVGDTVFTGNRAWALGPASGGAIHADGGVDVSGGSFIGNSAVSVISNGDATGGAVASTAISVRGARFEGNRVGAVFVDAAAAGGAIFATERLAVEDAVFVGNVGTSPFTTEELPSGGGAIAFVARSPQARSVDITGATFTGNGFNGYGGGIGGAVLAIAPAGVRIHRSTFEDNSAGASAAQIAAGGAVFTVVSPVVITASRFAGNRTIVGAGGSFGFGGAIASDTTLAIEDSTFESNQAVGPVGTAAGGAIWAYGDSLAIARSEFTSNTSDGVGGAILARLRVDLSSSTFSSNRAIGSGGAIASLFFANIGVVNSTFVGNSAGADGGAIRTAGDLDLTHATFVDNVGVHGNALSAAGGTLRSRGSLFVGGDCSATTIEESGGNVSASAGCPGGVTTRGALKLGILGGNGGPTSTVPLLSGSAAIDASGDILGCRLGVDQRGYARPVGLGCDAGAYESDFVPLRRLTFGGPWAVSSGRAAAVSVRPTAIVEPATPGCLVRWTVRDAHGTVIATTSGTSRMDGVAASAGPVNLAPGTYRVTVAFVGGCGGESDTYGAIDIVRGSATWGSSGSGWYRSPATGTRIDFREQVDASASFDARAGSTSIETRVNLTWTVEAAWRLRSSFTVVSSDPAPGPSPFQPVACSRLPDGVSVGGGSASGKCAIWSGRGTLEAWDAPSRSWVRAQQVWYRAKAYDGGAAAICASGGRCRSAYLQDWFTVSEIRADSATGQLVDSVPTDTSVVRLATPIGSGSISNSWPDGD